MAAASPTDIAAASSISAMHRRSPVAATARRHAASGSARPAAVFGRHRPAVTAEQSRSSSALGRRSLLAPARSRSQIAADEPCVAEPRKPCSVKDRGDRVSAVDASEPAVEPVARCCQLRPSLQARKIAGKAGTGRASTGPRRRRGPDRRNAGRRPRRPASRHAALPETAAAYGVTSGRRSKNTEPPFSRRFRIGKDVRLIGALVDRRAPEFGEPDRAWRPGTQASGRHRFLGTADPVRRWALAHQPGDDPCDGRPTDLPASRSVIGDADAVSRVRVARHNASSKALAPDATVAPPSRRASSARRKAIRIARWRKTSLSRQSASGM